MKRTGSLVVLACMATACGAPVMQPDLPALVTNPGPETRQEIEQTVATALNGTNITLAEDVLTKTSVLVIERGMQRDINRPPELGRDLGRPYRFQLVMNGSHCMLVDQQTMQHWPLANVECVKE